MRVIAFTKYDRESATTRQRFLQYAPHLEAAGISFEYRPLLEQGYVRSLTTGEGWSKAAVARSYLRRLGELARGPGADLLWVSTEFFPYLPSAFERLALRAGVPVVVDWDDANFVKYNEAGSRLVRALLAGKLERLLAGSAAATCGTQYLRDYAGQYCPLSVTVPTVVDIDIYRPAPRGRDGLVIGWIGSPSTWPNVRQVLPVLRELCASGEVRFRAVGAGVEAERDRFEGLELVAWSEENEVAEVQGFDIGIIPLIDGPFERGKCAYKLIQYMGCGVAAVASPVGVNADVLTPGCGLLATTAEEWREALSRLVGDAALRRRMGAAGRKRAVAHYSLQAHAPRLVELFRELRNRGGQAGG
jgi:glycosyltransferase involved in cell wall biosynthesis